VARGLNRIVAPAHRRTGEPAYLIMRYEYLISLRYLRAKRKEVFISLITVISTLGVMIGVMTLNIVLAVMTGFEEDLRDRILGFNPHVLVQAEEGAVADSNELLARVRVIEGVLDASPFVSGQVMLASQENVVGVTVRGITAAAGKILDVSSRLKYGDLADLATRHQVTDEASGRTVDLAGVIIGKDISRDLGLRIGDPVSVVSPLSRPTAVGMVPRVKRFAVVGVFESGMAEYDAGLVLIDLPQAQRFFDLGSGVTGIELRTGDLNRAGEVAQALREHLGTAYRVRDWMEINHSLFSALRLEKTVYFIVLLLIVLVAAFNIVATLVMVVMEKREDIAILKSMGATRSSVRRIFVSNGLVVGLAGTIAGDAIGLAACWALQRYELIELPKDVFYVNTLPVKIYPEYFVLVTVAAVVICMAATLYPAWQASRLSPVDVIRYE